MGARPGLAANANGRLPGSRTPTDLGAPIDQGATLPALILILVAAGVVAVAFLVVASLKRVPQGRVLLVQRLGRHHRTLDAGVHLILPGLESVRYSIDTRPMVVPLSTMTMTTQDGAVLEVYIKIYVQVTDPVKSVYAVSNYVQALEGLALDTARTVVGEMPLEQAPASRAAIGTAVHRDLARSADAWGVRLDRVLVDIAGA